MKTYILPTLTFIFLMLFVSCKSDKSIKQILSKEVTRQEVMNKIANNSSMSTEMIEALVNSSRGNTAILESQLVMLKMTEDYQGRMQLIRNNSVSNGINNHGNNSTMHMEMMAN